MSFSSKPTSRVNWGRFSKPLPGLDLIAIQRNSFQRFLSQEIGQLISEISPVDDFTGKNWQLTLGEYTFSKSKLTPEKAIRKRLTYDQAIKVEATLLNKKTGREVKKQVFLGDIPQMTRVGTFIINGIERCIINQIIRSPGAFFSGVADKNSGRLLHSAEIRPIHGSWLEFSVNRNDVISVRVDRRRKFPATVLLRAFGLSTDEEIMACFKDEPQAHREFILTTLAEDSKKTTQEALIEIYQKIRPGEPVVLENAKELLNRMFFDPRRYQLGKVGRFKLNRRLGLEIENTKENRVLTRQDVVAAIKYLVGLQNGQGEVDDIDHLANRRIRQVGELVAENAFRPGILRLERSIKEKMSLFSTEEPVTPVQLVNARPIIVSVNEFFRSNQLSTVLDQTNPLAELDNLRRISVMGSGGITRDRASFSIRDVNASQYGRICPIRSPEGPNIGLVTYMALFARINDYGFLETPYYRAKKIKKAGKVKIKITDEIVYLSPDDESEHYITHAEVKVDKDGYILDSWVPVRHKGEFLESSVEKVDFVDLVPQQVVGASASLVPFLAHDMPNRALMGTHMQCQAVPLVSPEAPVVGTGWEKLIANAMGHTVCSRHDGEIEYVDANRVVLKLKAKTDLPDEAGIKIEGKKEIYAVSKFNRCNPNSTCYSQKPVVTVGQKVKKGDLLIDGPSCDKGETALGRNLLVAYCSYDGLEYEDAIVISDRLAKEDVLTSVSIEEHETSLVETKLGPEELTRDIPNVSETDLANLAEDGIVVVGSFVGSNDILVGKIAPKGETELTAEERLLRAIFGEKAREVRDTSLRLPHGEEGVVIDVQILDREKGDELEAGTIQKVIIRVAQLRKIKVGDKLAGRHGNKGVISKVVPEEDMPYLEDGTPVDIVISPASVLSRMNLGQLFEAHLGWAAQKLGYNVAAPVFERISEAKIIEEMKKANLPADGKVTLYDGRTGEPREYKTVVGVGYILKLVHMVDDKSHARATGPYSLVTQQPLGGKAQMGGQRLGEMEVWALESHRAAHVLQEMLTIKSDDVVGRAKAFEAIVRNVEIPESTVPESFKVLVKELNSLGLEINPMEVVKAEKENQAFENIIDFKSLQVKLASPEMIKSWSHGEVVKPETINYRTLRTEKDGLFCEKIFGPVKDWECYCGKYKRIRYRGVICDRCGVEVTRSRVRRERMGHITLAAPAAHIWFFKGSSSKLSLLLDIPPKGLESVIYFAQYLVTDVDQKKKAKILDRLEADLAKKKKALKERLEKEVAKIEKIGEKDKKKIEKKIKTKEQRVMAIQEANLKIKQQIQSLRDELILEHDRAEEVYRTLTNMVTALRDLSLLTEDSYLKLRDYQAASFFKAGMGAEILLKVIEKMDLEKLTAELREQAAKAKGGRFLKITKRLRLVEKIRKNGINPSWMIMKVLPVIPPDLRPMVQLSGGRFATSDLNDLYRRVINRNNRLKKLIDLGAPEIILRNEKRMLQEAVGSLIDANKVPARRYRRQIRPTRSLSEMLRGKQGRFRQNLLGKRVDYSGRSVIVVGPELTLNQCGLPKEMALEMFKPFVLREIILTGLAPNVKSAKYILEHQPPEVFDILEKVTRKHPVLLNRAPTLHKLGIQAFYPVLVEESAIKLHPCVCAGFNADFDGDQMAVHVPLGKKAIEEAETLMRPETNLLRPADGSPITIPNKEMALGVYFLTSPQVGLETASMFFTNTKEAILAYQSGLIKLRQPIKVKKNGKLMETTVGRLLFNEVVPKEMGFINETIRQKMIKTLVTRAMQVCDLVKVVKLIDGLKRLGFKGATESGLSVSVWDCRVYPQRDKIIGEANQKASQIEKNFNLGLITEQERRRLIQEIWMDTTDNLAEKTWQELDSQNSIYLMVDAGLRRTSKEQIKQLSAMQGLVVDPMGKIVELPIKSNFRQGLSVFEYLTSARGARKGLTDKALKTADAGYLTRRLVDATHDIIIRQEDCGTKKGLKVSRLGNRGDKFLERVLGRVLAKNVLLPKTKKTLLAAGELMTENSLGLLKKHKIEEVMVRSPLLCESRYGMCANCYGWDFSTRQKVEIGMPVGVVAAQSIGEPGTQLTLRTFHTGGGVGVADVTQGLPRVQELFEARIPKTMAPLSEIAGKVKIEETEEGYQVKVKNVGIKPVEEKEYLISLASNLAVKNGQLIDAGTQLAAGALDVKEVLEIRGLQAAQEYLLEEIQAVYESQGIPISDKHFEVVIRRMTDKVKIDSTGDTEFLPGDLVSKTAFEEENAKVMAEGGEPSTARVVILGLIRASLFTESWLSAASFQETTNVLTNAALEAKEDHLLGLKENVIIGRLIPVSPERAKIK